jgi:hypothetical protein
LPSIPGDAKSTRCGIDASDAEFKLLLSIIVIFLAGLLNYVALCRLVVSVPGKALSQTTKISLI